MVVIQDGMSMFGMIYEAWLKSELWITLQRQNGYTIPSLRDVTDDRSVMVQINSNRLLAKCPACMGGAEYIWRNGPHIMFCANCGNSDIQGKFRTVLIPEYLGDIEKELMLRPDPANRNWMYPETVDDLIEEREYFTKLQEQEISK